MENEKFTRLTAERINKIYPQNNIKVSWKIDDLKKVYEKDNKIYAKFRCAIFYHIMHDTINLLLKTNKN